MAQSTAVASALRRVTRAVAREEGIDVEHNKLPILRASSCRVRTMLFPIADTEVGSEIVSLR